jgi:hypothetical protein
MFSFFFTLLLIGECLHVVAHFAVLVGIHTVNTNLTNRKIYFSLDLLGVILSYVCFETNLMLVSIHTIIHVGAIFYLFGMKSTFYAAVYKMAEGVWENHSLLMKLSYIAGTFEDILTHMMNIYFISNYFCRLN